MNMLLKIVVGLLIWLNGQGEQRRRRDRNQEDEGEDDITSNPTREQDECRTKHVTNHKREHHQAHTHTHTSTYATNGKQDREFEAHDHEESTAT